MDLLPRPCRRSFDEAVDGEAPRFRRQVRRDLGRQHRPGTVHGQRNTAAIRQAEAVTARALSNVACDDRLRLIEVVVVPDERFGRALLLRDSQGIGEKPVIVPAPLIPIVARFTGQFTPEEIAQEVSRETGKAVPCPPGIRISVS